MQNSGSRGVPGSCTMDAGVCLREQVGRCEGIPATHSTNSIAEQLWSPDVLWHSKVM